jgi:hypothetical protein
MKLRRPPTGSFFVGRRIQVPDIRAREEKMAVSLERQFEELVRKFDRVSPPQVKISHKLKSAFKKGMMELQRRPNLTIVGVIVDYSMQSNKEFFEFFGFAKPQGFGGQYRLVTPEGKEKVTPFGLQRPHRDSQVQNIFSVMKDKTTHGGTGENSFVENLILSVEANFTQQQK